jgi:spoIIIJ-associated protein
MAQSKAEGTHLEKTIRNALRDLVDGNEEGLRVRIDLPRGLEIKRAEVLIEGDYHGGESLSDDDQDVDENVDEGRDEEDRQPRRRPAPEASDEEGTEGGLTVEDLDEEADAAADFIEGLLDAMDLPGSLKLRIDPEAVQAEVEIVDVGSGVLIGRRGQTLESIQELLRSALQREFQRRSRTVIDVEGYRARRLEKLLEKAEDVIDQVLDTGKSERLEPMDVFERKSIHHLVAQVEGVSSRSQGREPTRRVIIEPSDD